MPGFDVAALAVSPDLTALHERDPRRYPFLLESVARGSPRARFDVLFAFPASILLLRPDGILERDGNVLAHSDFLAAFDADWRTQLDDAEAAHALPFTGGWFVFFAYEFASRIEPVLGHPETALPVPLALAVRIPAAVVRDHEKECTYLVCEREVSAAHMAVMQRDLESTAPDAVAPCGIPVADEEDPRQFLAGVERIREYIRSGDVFQVNLARRWQLRCATESVPAVVYRRLRETNPAPFAALARLTPECAVISSSPERLVAVRDGIVSTRPIAGTFPRGACAAEDERLARELLGHPKERAEHVMLIDLERNDLGRVCRPGTVQVAELMALESYRHVHHIVSEIRGSLRPDWSPGDVVRAVFPGGTITGCPKIRCMQIIAELEQSPRGAYTGSMGYINRDGSMDLNILIRTLVQSGDRLSLHAGAGIVADSVPERELNETRIKARGLLAALGVPA
jgi:anthranilate synthase component I